ncbi:HEPN domain-containing protein [Aliiglaciecola sp. 2_MG-2023]|uniref:HEPN domain-containing protein n=1 Tax=unclassified Aliiglaciecola TaxID=2593648 RepID=UPI0026E456F6|nr:MULTISPECIES: HEPN domain-containing protein [unclassified Aliiglaciecola]MDO6710349.1 HEPN domain-containing protein [Aliiglaciecola sp. 2_MG-2023]MDO6751496.1 HEPN domain-containing protein [Aliiglaciecola sp. 1_MG-2023]
MSEAGKSFECAIKDAEELLVRFDNENNISSASNSETLKRAGMVIAMAAWETYVKERFTEEIDFWIASVNGSLLGNFVQRKADEDLKRFFNPNTDRIKQLFKSYFEVDITSGWVWDNYQAPQAKKVLNELIAKRGDAAHKANTNPSGAHIVKRDELEKAIRFLKGLVKATEKVVIVKKF